MPKTNPPRASDWRILVLDEHASHTIEDFMFTTYKNKVQLVFLPPHTSHKTQPLDRSVFGPLKTYFRQTTKALGAHTASAAVNKRRFLYAYLDSSKAGMTSRNIMSGFKKTGIWPFNPKAVLDNPEAIVEDEALPATPPRASTPTHTALDELGNPIGIFQTPQKSRDLYGQLQAVSRDVRLVIGKAGKALDQKNATIAGLKAQVDYLTTELEAHRPHTRKKVRESGNDKFASIQEIVEAQQASQQPPKRRRQGGGSTQTTRTPVRQKVVEQAQEMIVHRLDRIHEQEEG